MQDEIDRCFQILELESGATFEQVKQARREMAKVWHPDRFANDSKLRQKADDRMKEANRAYDILERWFASAGGRSAGGSTQTGDTSGFSGQGVRQEKPRPGPQAADTGTTRPDPPRAEPAQSSSSDGPAPPQHGTAHSGVRGCLIAVIIGVAVMLAVILGTRSASPPPAPVAGAGRSGAGKHAGPDSGLVPTPGTLPPIARAVDEKNGFKEFKFGMSREAAIAIAQPTETRDVPISGATSFIYRQTPVNRIGDFVVDEVALSFFQNSLFRVDLTFSRNGPEILEAFRANFGEPFETKGWMRNGIELHAIEWRGQRDSAVMLAMPGQVWDAAVICDRGLNGRAQKYYEDAPLRAAEAFSKHGFHGLELGTALESAPWGYRIVRTDSMAHTVRAEFRSEGLSDIGPYRVDSVTGDYFEGQLFRIDLKFTQNANEVFRAFEYSFTPVFVDLSWKSAVQELTARTGERDGIRASILAGPAKLGESPKWDTIVLRDFLLWKAAQDYVANAPARAARDL